MEKLKLSVAERFSLTNLLTEIYRAGGLDLKSLKKAFNVMDKIEMTEKEAKQIKLKQTGATITWDPKSAKDVEIEFSKDEADLIREAVKDKNEKKGFTMADKNILTLAEKLELEI